MNRFFVLSALAVAGFAVSAHATTLTGLADWCVGLNGDTSTACNGAGSGGTAQFGGGINLAAFDTTAEPATNALGQIVVNLQAGENNQYSAFFANYNLDYGTDGAFVDEAATFGALASGESYEIEDPGTGTTYLFGDFAAANNSTPLADFNEESSSVATTTPPNVCCNVGFALAVSGLNVAAGGTGTVTYTVSTTAPGSGFYIQQTNLVGEDSIYISAAVNIQNPVSGTPEPSTFLMGFGVLGVGLIMKAWRSRSARAQQDLA